MDEHRRGVRRARPAGTQARAQGRSAAAGTAPGRGPRAKGRTPVIPGTGKRFSCNMISTVTNRGTPAFMVFTERFTAPVMIRFLKRLTRHAG
ncbi:MAG: transposase, partial [Phycisphaerales bacterium]|nr:transposase [Phycisphaerales bacterium]